MKIKIHLALLLLAAMGFLSLNVRIGYAGPVAAPRASSYEIAWATVDSGGQTSAGGAYTLSGTIGQPDAGSLSGGIYSHRGGYWIEVFGSPINLSSSLYLPFLRR